MKGTLQHVTNLVPLVFVLFLLGSTETALLAQTSDPEPVLTLEQWYVPSAAEKNHKTLQNSNNRKQLLGSFFLTRLSKKSVYSESFRALPKVHVQIPY